MNTILTTPGLFDKEHPAGIALLKSWSKLKNHKGDRAQLRRCKNLGEVQQTSAFQKIYWQIKDEFNQENIQPSREQLAIIIVLLAYINEDNKTFIEDGETKQEFFGYQISKGDKPILSELRFRRLLKIKERRKLFRFLVQVIRLLDKKVSILDLMSIVYFWGDKTKIKLAYKYYEKAKLDKQED